MPRPVADALVETLDPGAFFQLEPSSRLGLLHGVEGYLRDRGVVPFLCSFGHAVYNAETLLGVLPLFRDPAEACRGERLAAEEHAAYFRLLGALYGWGVTPASFVNLLRVIRAGSGGAPLAVEALTAAVAADTEASTRERAQPSFFRFDGKGSGISNVFAGTPKWPFSRDLGFWGTFLFDSFLEDEVAGGVTSRTGRSLLSLFAENGDGMTVRCRGRKLCVSIVVGKEVVVATGEGDELEPGAWYTIGVVAFRPRFVGKSTITVYLNEKVYFQGNLPFVYPRSQIKSCGFGNNMSGRMGACLLTNENCAQSTVASIHAALASGDPQRFLELDVAQRALVSYHPLKVHHSMCIDLGHAVVPGGVRGEMSERTSRWLVVGPRDTLKCVGGTAVVLSLLDSHVGSRPSRPGSALTSMSRGNSPGLSAGTGLPATLSLADIQGGPAEKPPACCSLSDVLGLLVLFLTDHRENVKDFVDNDGVSMLEYILRTAILSFSVEDCDLLVTRICALAKVSSGASGGSSSVQRLVLRRILFNFSIWQRSPSVSVQNRILARLTQALEENPSTISRIVGAQIFLDGCRDSYLPASAGGADPEVLAHSPQSPGAQFRDEVFGMLAVVLSNSVEKEDIEACLRFLVNCTNPKTLCGGLKILLGLFLETRSDAGAKLFDVFRKAMNPKDSKHMTYPIFLIRRLGEYEDVQSRCLIIRLLSVYIANYSSRAPAAPRTKARAFRHSLKILINNDGKAGPGLAELLHSKGAYQLMHHNLSRHRLSFQDEEAYYDALIAFLVCESSRRRRLSKRTLSFNNLKDVPANVIDDNQVIRNPQAWCTVLKVLLKMPDSMQARALQDFLLLLTYNRENKESIISQKDWQFAFYPLLNKAYAGRFDAPDAAADDDSVSPTKIRQKQDIFPISLKLSTILLSHALINSQDGWMEVEQMVSLAPLTEHAQEITNAVLIDVTGAVKKEVQAQLTKNIYWPAGNKNDGASGGSNRSSPTASGSSTAPPYPWVLLNLGNLAAIVEQYVLLNECSLDGKPAAQNVEMVGGGGGDGGDFVILEKQKGAGESASKKVEDDIAGKEPVRGAGTTGPVPSPVVPNCLILSAKAVLSVYDQILFSVGSVANKILWTRCGPERENHYLNQRGPLIFVLLRLSTIIMRHADPCSEDAVANASRLRVIALSLMWGIHNTNVRSPSTSIDYDNGVLGGSRGKGGPSKSLSDIGTMSELLDAVSSRRTSLRGDGEHRVESKQPRRRGGSLNEMGLLHGQSPTGWDGMYLLDEEEQWAMALVEAIKRSLREVRQTIFDENGKADVGGVEEDGDAKAAALLKVELASKYSDTLLRILADVVNGTKDIMKDHFSSDAYEAIVQLIDVHKNSSSVPSAKAGAEDADETTVATKRATEKLMSWLYGPWLMLRAEESEDNESTVALSMSERNILENMQSHHEYKWQEYVSWEGDWEKSDISKSLSSRARQIEDKLNGDEVNRRASLSSLEEDHFVASGRKWSKMSEDINFEIGDVDEVGHWMMSAREDTLRRRRLLCPNFEFDQHEESRYGYRKSNSASPRSPPPDTTNTNQMTPVNSGTLKNLTNTPLPPLSSAKVVRDPSMSTPVDNTNDEDDEDDEDDAEWEDCDKIEQGNVATGAITNRTQSMFSLQSGEKFLFCATEVLWVTPLTVAHGRLDISNLNMFFYPSHSDLGKSSLANLASVADGKTMENMRWSLTDVRHVFNRRYLLRSNAMECFFRDKTNMFLSFEHHEDKERAKEIISKFSPVSSVSKVGVKQLRRIRTGKNQLAVFKEKWRKREISNFEYIMKLNTLAGRSYNDITQYPIFPWIIADYESKELDMTNPETFRDLSKPMGALNPDRLRQFLERYELFDGGGIPKFHYGSHYSSAGVVLHYLIRMEPFTSLAISLQGGKFDCPDRLFSSISECWHSCLHSMSDVKELIPEFYTTPEFLMNPDNFPLGTRQDGKVVNHVELPPWAANANEFVRINALALESEYVSQNLHRWIDLVFGFKQRGQEAERSHNLFYYLTYEGAVDLDSIEDDLERAATEAQIAHFGQTPSQLLRKPHPPRMRLEETRVPFLVIPAGSRYNMKLLKFVAKIPPLQKKHDKTPPVIFISVLPDKIVTIYADLSIAAHKWATNQKPDENGWTFRFEGQKRRYLSGAGAWSCLWNSSDWWTKSRPACFAAARDGAKRGKAVFSVGYLSNRIKFHSFLGQKINSGVSGAPHRGVVTCVTVCEDGKTLVSGSLDCTVRIWKEEGNGDEAFKLSKIIVTHHKPIVCVAASSLLDIAVSASLDGTLAVHCLSDGSRIRVWAYPGGFRPSLLAISKDGDMFAVSNNDHSLHSFSVNGKLLRSTKLFTRDVTCMVPTADGQYVILGGDDRVVSMRSTLDLSVTKHIQLEEEYGSIRSMELSIDYLFCGMADGSLIIIDVEEEEVK